MFTVDDLTLYHFVRSEFGPTDHRDEDWWEWMDPRLLVSLDVFRGMWGAPVNVSEHAQALGRHNGPENHSDHNVDRRCYVRGVDVFPQGLTTEADALRAMECATQAGFSSFGLYPHWLAGPGLHLGSRPERSPATPALWGAVNNEQGEQTYVSLHEALDQMG